MRNVDDENMNTTLHLPAKSQLKAKLHIHRFDDRPEVERNASPSELAMRDVKNIPLMRR